MEGLVQLAKLVHTCGTIEGRKKLQKLVHLLQSTGCGGFTQEFGYLHYGPYSPQLREEVEQLERLGLVKETPRPTPRAGTSLLSMDKPIDLRSS